MCIDLTSSPEERRQKFFELLTFSDLANLLEIKPEYLNYVLYRMPEERYTTFTIPKKTPNETRLISSPNSKIKLIQYKLKQVLECVYEPRQSVYGFIKDGTVKGETRNIVSNAKVHKGQRHVLNIDIDDFFPSIHFGRVRGLFSKIPYNLPEPVAKVLAQICCSENGLPQGAPTSPIISNMICNKMDSQLQRLAKRHRCFYTRYADDISFSTSMPIFPASLASLVGGETVLGVELDEIIKTNKFNINSNKTRLRKYYERQEVTGLTVNKFPNVTRKYVRQIRAMLYAWDKFGYEAAQQEHLEKYRNKHRFPNKKDLSFCEVVRGKIEFLGMVRGKQDAKYRRFLQQWSELSGIPLKNIETVDQEDDRTTDMDTNVPDSEVKKTVSTPIPLVFISYASEDVDIVEKIYSRLKDAGYKPWMDKEDILGGEDWKFAIKRAIDKADLFIICLSTIAVKKRGFLQKELVDALDKRAEKLPDDIFIIPLRLEECETPERLKHIHYIDYFSTNGWEKLIKSIEESIRRLQNT